MNEPGPWKTTSCGSYSRRDWSPTWAAAIATAAGRSWGWSAWRPQEDDRAGLIALACGSAPTHDDAMAAADEALRAAGYLPLPGLLAATVEDTPTGTDRAPDRYTLADGTEALDAIRAALGDRGFVSWCLGNALKYRLRAGRKGPAEVDLAKAAFYDAMMVHVLADGPDPRSYRS